MKDLLSLQKIFNDSLFRIPDYQRGYSWNNLQLEEFWSDLISLLPYQDHYTGMISLKPLKNEEIFNNSNEWLTEKWLVDGGYTVFEVVDGQQRLTTLIILINEIVDYCKKNNISELNSVSLNEIEEKYLYKLKNNGIVRTYKFGYEEDNPSYLYFRYEILNEPNKPQIEETFYTLNLFNAKIFFKDKIENLVNEKGFKELENIYKKITLNLKFNMYYIEDDFNVFVAFETMNNRGKKLSYLELLKNRLIYLSTLFDNDEDEKASVRENINNTWKIIYNFLGKNKNFPLSDDEFLQNHWMIYFGYQTRKVQGNQTIPYYTYLLNKYFIQQNIDPNSNYIPKLDEGIINDSQEENENEIDENNELDSHEITDKKIVLTLNNINDYVNSLKTLIPYWYEMHFPDANNNSLEISKYLNRLMYLGHVNARPLIMVLLLKDNILETDKIECLRLIERFNFLHYRFNGYSSTYNNSVFYNFARDLYYNNKDIKEIIDSISNIDYMADNKVISSTGAIEKFKNMFKRDGFYSWGTIKYLLYIYDLNDTVTLSEQHINPKEYFKQDPRDSYSVEHIYPQKATDEYWTKRFNMYSEKERKILSSSLGNLLPLSSRINSKLQNNSFDIKKKRYEEGSRSEIKVSLHEEWNPLCILNRGMEILNFIEKEFDFVIPNDADRKKILGLDFMIEEIDEYTNALEPIYEEKPIENTRVFSDDIFNELKSIVTDDEIIKTYYELEKYCLSLGNDVKRHTTKNYIAFYSSQIFVEFHFHTNYAHLMLCDVEYIDPSNKVFRLGENYNWTKNMRIDVYPGDDLEYVKNIILQSYNTLK